MEGPANTLNYMVAGYAVIFVVIFIYLASLVIRWRNLRQDEALLEQLEEQNPEEKSYESSSANVKVV